ncbi:MAG: LysM peptidoglycan-binding domain-containing protein, partial [Solirubrobacteraceae bacterium]
MRVRAFLLAVLVLALFPVAASADYAHVVAPGETLTSVAAVDGLSIAVIARANGISPQSQLIAGQTLWIPPRTTPNTVGADAATTTGGGTEQVVATNSAGGPMPTSERVSPVEIAGVADANSVPAALAEAIAWQESGWNNDEVSSVGAVGVMQ